MSDAEAELFPRADDDYDASVATLAQDVEDINGPAGVSLLRDLRPDVVINSGGPIYKRALIEAAPLMLNYQTGLSPIYNGSESIF